MLHAAARWSVGEMVEEHIVIEGTIAHPTGCRGHDFTQHGDDLIHIVVGGFGVNHYAIVSAALVEIRVFERSHLNRRVDQTIIILGAESSFLRKSQRRGDAPSLGKMVEAHTHRLTSSVHRIDQKLRQIEEGMMRVELCAEWTEGININLILQNCATFGTGNLPATLGQRLHGKRPAGAVFRADPVHVLSEVANLIERIPDGKLQLALRRSCGQDDLNFYQMMFGICERDSIFGRGSATRQSEPEQQNDRDDFAHGGGPQIEMLHWFPVALAAPALPRSSARTANRAGSFS